MQVLRIQTPQLFVITRMSRFPSPTDAQDRRLVTGGKNLLFKTLSRAANNIFSLPHFGIHLASENAPNQMSGRR